MNRSDKRLLAVFGLFSLFAVGFLVWLGARGAFRQPRVFGREDRSPKLPPRIVFGQVVGPDGKPVGGAVVTWLGEQERTTGQPLDSSATDAQGHFRFHVARAPQSSSLFIENDAYHDVLIVDAPGYGRAAVYAFNPPSAMQVKLTRPYDVELLLVEPNGRPISGIRVEMRFQNARRPPHTPRDLAVPPDAFTDAGGVARFPGIAASGDISVSPNSNELGKQTFMGETARIVGGRRIRRWKLVAARLGPGGVGRISGRVTFPDGRPAADVMLRVEREMQEAYNQGGIVISTTQTDASGNYSYNASANTTYEGRYSVSVASNMGSVKHFVAPQSFFLKLGQQKTNVNFVLTGSATAAGQVVDAKTGKPLSYVKVAVPDIIAERGSPLNLSEIDTDSNGRYRLQIPSGKVILELDQMRAWRAGQKRKTSHQTINAKPGETITVNWRVPAIGASRP